MKIAVIGTGIAGLGAGYALSRAHEVELFEANRYAGGHANTVTVDSHEIDTGFIVHRDLQIVLSRAANDALPSFPSTRPSF